MLAAILLALAIPNQTPKPGFDELLECMDTNVARYASVTADFSMALDAAWESCKSLSARESIALSKVTPPKVLDGLSAADIHKTNKEFMYGEYRGHLAKVFLDAKEEMREAGSPH